MRNIVLGLLGVVVLLIVIASVASNGGTNSPGASSTTNRPAAAVNNPPATQVTDPAGQTCDSLDGKGYCPGDDPASSPAAPQYTASQQSAITDAEQYLSTEPGFSKAGLVGQLEFDQFSYADADFAVNHISVNWRQQAADDAHNYMTTEGGFSCGSLVSQLEFDKFTPSQAQFGAHAVGLC